MKSCRIAPSAPSPPSDLAALAGGFVYAKTPTLSAQAEAKVRAAAEKNGFLAEPKKSCHRFFGISGTAPLPFNAFERAPCDWLPAALLTNKLEDLSDQTPGT